MVLTEVRELAERVESLKSRLKELQARWRLYTGE
jgi:hypothetical protein